MHPAIEAVLKHFEYEHLPPNLQEISKPICELAKKYAELLPNDPQTTLGLHDLLRAKDCFVRAARSAKTP